MNLQTDVRPDVGVPKRDRFIPFGPSGAFQSAGDAGQVQRLAIRGAGVTVLFSGLSLAVQIVATIGLARLLAPADFGLVAMVTTFSLLLSNFGLNGFTEAIIQREEMDHTLASNIFWISVAAGLFLTLGFAAAASLLVRFYHNSLVEPVAVGMSVTILITSISVVHLALLKRAMLFSILSANDILSRVASVAVSVILALLGCGYWALVAGAVAQPLSQTIGAWVQCRWIPGRPRRAAGTASVVRFAISVYGRFSFSYFGRNTDNVLVGWHFGAQSLGFYKRAYDLFALSFAQLTAPLTNVAVSALSRVKPGSEEFNRLLIRALTVMAFLGMAVGAELTLIGRDVIRLLLGPAWAPAGRIFSFFGPGIGIMLLYHTHSWIHLSIGKPDRWFRWGIIEFVFTAILFLLGLHWGPDGVAVAWTVSFWALTIPALWYALKPIDLGVTPVLAAVWRYTLASLVAGGASAMLMRSLKPLSAAPGAGPALARIVIVSLVFLILYLCSVVLLYGGLLPLRELAGLWSAMAPAGKFPDAPPSAETCETSAPGALISECAGLKSLEKAVSRAEWRPVPPGLHLEAWRRDFAASRPAEPSASHGEEINEST
jgi:O-antigen/teichoic acid export membrane protein